MAYDKAQYVQRKWRSTLIFVIVADVAAASYAVFAIVKWLLGDSQKIHDDLFEFALEALAFSILFLGFCWLIKTIVLSAASKQQ